MFITKYKMSFYGLLINHLCNLSRNKQKTRTSYWLILDFTYFLYDPQYQVRTLVL